MYQALYRACRPEVFSQVLGQEHIVRILKNQIKTGNTNHAYIFYGTRGTGKTTTARLLAKGINCLSGGDRPCGECANCRAISEGNFLDVIEIDAASNNSVDNIRDLRESVNYPPAVGRKKVYIIDEVHMLSQGAFNALLKTLEEPPEYVVFILATTEINKLPATVLSRCMRLDFKRIPENVLTAGMADICENMGIKATDGALRIIAANSDGSVRDGLSILDQCIAGGDTVIEEQDVLSFLGASGEEDFLKLTDFVRKKDTASAIMYLGEILADGKDVRQFIKDWINHCRNLLMTKFIREPSAVLNLSSESIERIGHQSRVMETKDINDSILELSKTSNDARWSTQPRILLELAIVRLCEGVGEVKTIPVSAKAPAKASVAPPGKAPAKASVKEKEQEQPQPEFSELQQPEIPEEATVEMPKEMPTEAHQEEPAEEDKASEGVDCEALWEEVFRQGEQINGSFFLVRKGGMLVEVADNHFTVSAVSNMKKALIEKERNLIEDLMEKITGKRRTMRIVVSEERNSLSADEIARNGSEALGIHIDVE